MQLMTRWYPPAGHPHVRINLLAKGVRYKRPKRAGGYVVALSAVFGGWLAAMAVVVVTGFDFQRWGQPERSLAVVTAAATAALVGIGVVRAIAWLAPRVWDRL
jgi:hypothetical protein